MNPSPESSVGAMRELRSGRIDSRVQRTASREPALAEPSDKTTASPTASP
jgi:hypothetical protein